MAMIRYPLPITAAMLAPANPNFDKPRYNASWTSDWHGAQFGNEEDQAEATQAIANSCSARVETDYDPQHQKAKAADMVPPRQIVDDIGKDYGIYAGAPGRTGYVTPRAPYPDATSPPVVTSISPLSGLAAGGTAITITGMGFTGATAVTVGGTAATSVVVVDPGTITAVTPAHAVGTVDVVVTTPKGTSPVSTVADNFVYT
jgi:hypothetical protein